MVPHVGRWGGGGRRGRKCVARDELLAPITNSRGLGGALLADGFVGRVEAIDPQTDEYGAARAPTHHKISTLRRTRESGITARKTPRKPQKAARAAGLRRAPPHHSPQARSGILNRKTLRMLPMAACAAEEGRPTQDLPLPSHRSARTPTPPPTRESVIAQTQDTA